MDSTLKQVLTSLFHNHHKRIVSCIYPVGAIYLSTSDIDPSVLFPDTEWEQIKDTFLLSAGETYKAGEIGGEAITSLTLDQLPSHNHDIKITSDSEEINHSHAFSAITGTETINHTHSGTTNSSGSHIHSFSISGSDGDSTNNTMGLRVNTTAISSDSLSMSTHDSGVHTHDLTTGVPNNNHQHHISGTTDIHSHSHKHTIQGSTDTSGAGNHHNNMPPYLTVYMWKRIK